MKNLMNQSEADPKQQHLQFKDKLTKAVKSFDFAIFSNPNGLANFEKTFNNFCFLIMILYGKIERQEQHTPQVMNEFLKNLNVLQLIRNMVSLVEKRKYKIESLIHFTNALASFEENELIKELEEKIELPNELNILSQSTDRKKNPLEDFTTIIVQYALAYDKYYVSRRAKKTTIPLQSRVNKPILSKPTSRPSSGIRVSRSPLVTHSPSSANKPSAVVKRVAYKAPTAASRNSSISSTKNYDLPRS